METPEWMTHELVQKFLGDSGEQLESFTVESATKPGDNFLSIIYCVKVKTNESQKSLIVKTAIPLEELEAFRAFPKEILAYQEYVPQFERLWSKYAGEEVSFGAKCHFAANGEPMVVIVMDDLRALGYAVRDRKQGLNGREMRMVLEKAAKFHACSVKYAEEVGPFHEDFDEGVARSGLGDAMGVYYGALYEGFMWGLENKLDNGSAYAHKLLPLRDNQFTLLQKLTRADPGQLNVLCHLDMWVNNLLFDGTPETSTDVKLIDYQISQWSSPTVDVLHSIFNSCEPKTIVEEFDAFVEFYYNHLVEALKKLQCKKAAPSFKSFLETMGEKVALVVIYITETIALARADTSLNLDLEALTDESPEAVESRRSIFSSPEFIETMTWLMPFLDKRGWLERF